VLFSLKNCKNRQTLGAPPPRPPTLVNLHFEFSLHLPINVQILSESTKRPYFLVIIAGVHQVFGVEKICCSLYAKNYGNYNDRFQYFSFCLPPPLILRWRRLCPPPTKTAEIKVKNRRKSAEEAKADEYLLFVTPAYFSKYTIKYH